MTTQNALSGGVVLLESTDPTIPSSSFSARRFLVDPPISAQRRQDPTMAKRPRRFSCDGLEVATRLSVLSLERGCGLEKAETTGHHGSHPAGVTYRGVVSATEMKAAQGWLRPKATP